jgi:type III pantothenate kinase
VILLVDIGNTRVKWATYESGRLGASNAAAYANWDIADWRSALFSTQPVARVLAAAVAGSASRGKLAAAAASCGVPIQFVTTSASAGGVRNAYPDPSLLGIDRWIAMIGARHLRAQACCIVDIGTAATVDAVTADGVHLGGFIVPGPQLMVQSLLAGTSDLASHAARSGSIAGASALFANNTRDAIERGCRIALAALVDRAYRELAASSPTPPALLGTRGAVEEIAPYVLAPLEVVPDLVLHGLATLADAGT